MLDVLNLGIDTFSLSLREFLVNGYERTVLPVGGELEYALNGTPIVDGQLYEPKYLWTIAAFLTRSEWRQLWLIYRRSERKRTLDQDFAISLCDFVEPYVEDASTRSRALAPGGEVVALDGGGIEYPAKFAVRLYEPKFERCDNALTPFTVRAVLRELDTVPAA